MATLIKLARLAVMAGCRSRRLDHFVRGESRRPPPAALFCCRCTMNKYSNTFATAEYLSPGAGCIFLCACVNARNARRTSTGPAVRVRASALCSCLKTCPTHGRSHYRGYTSWKTTKQSLSHSTLGNRCLGVQSQCIVKVSTSPARVQAVLTQMWTKVVQLEYWADAVCRHACLM